MTPDSDSKRSIRVLMVMPSFHPIVGGMELQVERLIPFLLERGIEASVLTRQTTGTTRVDQHDGIQIRRIPVPGGPGLRSLVFTALGVVSIVRRSREIDILHAHSIMSPTTIAAIAGLILRKPRLVTLHATYEPEHLLKKPLGGLRLRLYQRVISRFVSINDDIGQLLRSHGIHESKIVSIPNGIDTIRFSPAADDARAALRVARRLPTDQPVVVFAGRLHPVKQVDVLLRAWSGVDGGTLVILGDGEERQRLKILADELGIQGRVEIRGMVPDVEHYLRAADIFVLPSASEGLSVALLEAMASGLVPVASAVGGAIGLIRDDDNGKLVPPGDVEALRSALQHALVDEGWRRSAAIRARASVACYDLRVVADRLAEIYRGDGSNACRR